MHVIAIVAMMLFLPLLELLLKKKKKFLPLTFIHTV